MSPPLAAHGRINYTAPVFIELLFAASLGASASTDLTAIAAASPRPPSCRQLELGKQRATIWKRAKNPKLVPYCNLVAKAHARLQAAPKQAFALAEKAEVLLPGRAATLTVKARASLARGQLEHALNYFKQASRIDPRSIEPPLVMRELALVKWRSGQLNEALALYRTLAPRMALLPNATSSLNAMLEAAHASMAVAASQPQPAAALDEALSFLQEAQRGRQRLYRRDLALSLALVLDRAGQSARADAVLASLPQLSRWLEQAPPAYVQHPVETEALRALSLDIQAPRKAIEHWTQYLNNKHSKGPWRKAAEARRSRLSSRLERTGKRR